MRCWPITAASTGCRSASATGVLATFWRPTSIGPFRASATGARPCRFGSVKKPATKKPWPVTPIFWPSRELTGTEVWQNAKRKNPDLPDDLAVHKPYIDAITYDSPKAAGAQDAPRAGGDRLLVRRRRDAFAQWGYPHQPGSDESFQGQFPADFISEALDRTRGWFYSLLAISTLLFGKDRDQESGGLSQDIFRGTMGLSPLAPRLHLQSLIPNP